MIYIIKSGDFIKIGFSENVENRLSSYKTHNPSCTILKTMPGSKQLEKHIHLCLKDIRHSGEWFKHTEDCLDRIYSSISSYKGDCVRDKKLYFYLEPSLLYSIKHLSDLKVFFCLCELCEYNIGMVIMSKKNRHEISSKTGVTLSNLSKSINRLSDGGFLKKNNGDILINPSISWKGSMNLIEDFHGKYSK